jgi:hypothetical protein
MRADLRAVAVAEDLDEVKIKLQSWLDQLNPDSVLFKLVTLYRDRWEHNAPSEELRALGDCLPLEADSSSEAAGAKLLVGDKLRDHGYSLQERRTLLEQAAQPKRGRKRAATTIEALEMKLRGATYREIADKLCDCGKPQWKPPAPHDKHCTEAIRKRVLALKAVLREYDRK